MNGIGGRTMWYCTTCGAALTVGRGTCSCGGKSQPEEALMATALPGDHGIVARAWRPIAKKLGLWDAAP